jgi:hypothetical protein
MDTLLDLFESHSKSKDVTSVPVTPLANYSTAKDASNPEKENHQPASIISAASTNTLDPISKIRITSRKISRAEQVDMLSPYQYHSSVTLASMNNQTLGSLIVTTRASSMDNKSSGVTGKTNMATIGVVLSASGTKMSSKGASFFAISIGELHTGPAVSILVFGEAYSAHVGKISNGQVIAIIASTILPPKAGTGETRITLTIRDVAQLVVIGTAQDYGLCSGTDTRKINGVMETVRCKMHVDKREGCFCKVHNKNNHQVNGGMAHWKRNKMTFVQSLKDERVQINNSLQSTFPRLPHQTTNNGIKMNGPVLPTFIQQEQGSGTLKSLLNREQSYTIHRHPTRIPIHLDTEKKQDTLQTKLHRGPYATQSKSELDGPSKKKETNDLLGLALDSKAGMIMERFTPPSTDIDNNNNGNRLSHPSSSLSYIPPIAIPLKSMNTPSVMASKKDKDSELAQRILDEQKKISSSIRNQTVKNEKSIHRIHKSNESAKPKSFEDIFGKTLETTEKVEILKSKSRFNAQAEDELYVNARLKVTELENREEMKQKIDTIKEKKKSRGSSGCIESAWKCHTCQMVFHQRPILCIQSKHIVGISRSIKTVTQNKNEERLRISRATVEEGGLILGKGINWSQLKDGSDSE